MWKYAADARLALPEDDGYGSTDESEDDQEGGGLMQMLRSERDARASASMSSEQRGEQEGLTIRTSDLPGPQPQEDLGATGISEHPDASLVVEDVLPTRARAGSTSSAFSNSRAQGIRRRPTRTTTNHSSSIGSMTSPLAVHFGMSKPFRRSSLIDVPEQTQVDCASPMSSMFSLHKKSSNKSLTRGGVAALKEELRETRAKSERIEAILESLEGE